MSLISEYCAETWDRLASNGKEGEEEVEGATADAKTRAHLARLVLAPTLIDTRDLTDATKTTVQRVGSGEGGTRALMAIYNHHRS